MLVFGGQRRRRAIPEYDTRMAKDVIMREMGARKGAGSARPSAEATPHRSPGNTLGGEEEPRRKSRRLP
jgi:hypothetical protein